MALTVKQIEAVKPSERRQELPDGSGLYFIVQPSGAASWVHRYRYGGKPVKLTLGTHPAMSLADARKMVLAHKAVLNAGDDPRDAKRAKQADARAMGFSDYADKWLERYATERRASGVALARSVVGQYLKPILKQKPIPTINRQDLQAVLNAVPASKRGMKRAVHAYASVLFNDAVAAGDIGGNPLDGMAKPAAPQARDRVLSDDELTAIWTAAAAMNDPWQAYWRLLILTGQRLREVSDMGWGELDRAAAIWTIPAHRAKNGAAHIVPLSSAAIAELDRLATGDEWPSSGFVLTTTGRTAISGFSKAKAAMDAASRVAPWRVHDVRRTAATGFQRLGVRFEVTEAILNHVSGAKGGVAGVYQRHDWKDEKRAALDAWATHVEALANG